MSRKTPISKTMRRAFVELADAAAYSKVKYQSGPDGTEADFFRVRYVVLENAIENIIYVALHWSRDEAKKYAVSLVLTREHHQRQFSPPTVTASEGAS